jgi:hypothetical protein
MTIAPDAGQISHLEGFQVQDRLSHRYLVIRLNLGNRDLGLNDLVFSLDSRRNPTITSMRGTFRPGPTGSVETELKVHLCTWIGTPHRLTGA